MSKKDTENAGSEHSETYGVLKTGNDSAVFAGMVSNINDFFWCRNLEGGSGEIYYSSSVKKITGYSPDEIGRIPGRFQALIHAEDAFDIRKIITEFENNPVKNSIELIYRIIDKSNEVKWVRESLNVDRGTSGRIVNYYGMVCDITAIKNSELQAREAEERLRKLNEAKDRFIAIISHDLRAPFTSILGFSEILLNEPNLADRDKQEYLNYIYESSQTQLHMVNYLLDWSRLQTGRIKMEPQRIKAKTIVENCISALTGNAIRKGINIRTNLPEDIYIQVDEKLMTQAILNLLSNAIKFTMDNRTVDVQIGHFKTGFIEFIVKDEGVGISEENKRKLFQFDQKFTQEGTKGEKGSGLGLTLVKQIIEKHGGDIWFYSELNKGSEFHFIIPEASKVILLVEDDNVSRALWLKASKRILSDFEIVQASNGYEAMTIINEKTPTLVVTDHNMPLMNGIQLIESMRKREETSRIPVIVVTALLPPDLVSKYEDLHVTALLEKPLNIEQFSAALLEAVD